MGGHPRMRPSVARDAQPARQHARQRGVALEQVVVEGGGRMHDRPATIEQPEQPFVQVFGELVQVVVAPDERGHVEQAEPAQREAGRRVIQPAAERHREQQRVQPQCVTAGDAFLPAGRAGHRLRRAGVQAPQQAQRDQREHRQAERLVQRVDLDLVGLFGISTIVQADDGHGQDQQHDQPVQHWLTGPQRSSVFFNVMASAPAWVRDRVGRGSRRGGHVGWLGCFARVLPCLRLRAAAHPSHRGQPASRRPRLASPLPRARVPRPRCAAPPRRR